MCTAVILRRPGHKWPLLFAGNRDEMRDRPAKGPARHWSDRPEVVGGLDITAGGTWLGVNEHGLLSSVLNRIGSLGPKAGKRSRGELVLEALDHADAESAAEALANLNPAAYRSFNLVIADNRAAFWLRNQGADDTQEVECFPIPEGLSMISAYDMNDPSSARIRRHMADFVAADVPDPEAADPEEESYQVENFIPPGWEGWHRLLRRDAAASGGDPYAAMSVQLDNGFETVSSSLIALSSAEYRAEQPQDARIRWLYAAGSPKKTSFRTLEFSEA